MDLLSGASEFFKSRVSRDRKYVAHGGVDRWSHGLFVTNLYISFISSKPDVHIQFINILQKLQHCTFVLASRRNFISSWGAWKNFVNGANRMGVFSAGRGRLKERRMSIYRDESDVLE